MERKPHSTVGNIVGAVVLLVVVPLGLYVGSYFALGKRYERSIPTGGGFTLNGGQQKDIVERTYAYDWLACGYRPCMYVEAAMIGKETWVTSPRWVYSSDGPAAGLRRMPIG